jgi:DNA-binding NarL/FixJ family response regulator
MPASNLSRDPAISPGSRERRARATRVLLVDEQPMARRALRLLLRDEPELEVVGESDQTDAPDQARVLAPDVVLIDADLRGAAGRRQIATVITASPRVRVLVVTGLADPTALVEALLAGASGYLLKTRAVGRLPRAIHEVMDGRVPIDDEVVRALRERLARPAPRPPGQDAADVPLTAREFTVLRLVGEGLTNEQIAADLVLAPGTVKLHVQRIIAKLGVANRTQAAVYAARKGLLSE